MARRDDNEIELRKVEAANRVVLPPAVVRHLGIQKGDYIGFEAVDDGVMLYKVSIQKAKRPMEP